MPASRRSTRRKALKVPGVLAVLTAEELKGVNLAWMPTLAGDVQMVLADGKVLFQNQEVAFVVADDRYVAADAADAVEVEYEELPVQRRSVQGDGRPTRRCMREDIKDKTEGAHGPRKHHNHIFTWEAGDKAATDAAFAKAEVEIKEMISYQRVHPCPLETCQCVASFDKIKGELTLWGTFQAPHVIRTVASLISRIPEHKIHVISPDIGGGFGNKVGAYPGYICAIVASIVTGLPVKWVEDRIENLSTTAFARDYHMDMEIAATKDGKITGLRCYTIADHGAFDACADPTKWPAGFFNIITGSYDIPVAHVSVDGVYTNKAPGGVAYRCSFRVTEAAYCHRARHRHPGAEARDGPGRLAHEELHPARAVPLHVGARLGIRFRRLSHRLDKALEAVDYKKLRAEQKAEAGGLQARRDPRADGHRRLLLHRDRRRRARRGIATFSASPCSIAPKSASTRPAQRIAGSAPSRKGRATRRPMPRSSPRELGLARRQHHGRGRQHRHRALRSRHLRLALDAGVRRRHRHGLPQDQGQGADDRRLHAGSA